MVVHSCDPSTWEKTGGSWFQCKHGLHSKTLSQKDKI
jgi:hypothetical protein